MYILNLSEGMSHGFPAIVIPQLREACSEFKITKEELSWIGDFFLLPLFLFVSENEMILND